MQARTSSIHFTDYSGALAALVVATQPVGKEGREDISTFLDELIAQTPDAVLNDPALLAVKFCVWQALQMGTTPTKPLDFNGLGIAVVEPPGITHRYKVLIGPTPSTRPNVLYEAT